MAEIKKPLHKFTGDVVVIDEHHTLKDIIRYLLEDMYPEELRSLVEEVIREYERSRNKTTKT